MATAANGERPILTAETPEAAARRLQSLAKEIADPAERRRAVAQALGTIQRRERAFGLENAPAAGPQILDAVLFCGEWELLDFRVNALAGVTARTLVVEADRTFSGSPRTFCLTDAEFARRGWQERVVAHRVALPEWLDNREIAEALQRNHLTDLVARFAGPSDHVLLSDIDEVPHADAVRAADTRPLALGMRQTLFFPNHERVAGTPRQHFGAALVPVSEFERRTPAEIREDARHPSPAGWTIRTDAGIHLQFAATGGPLQAHLGALGHTPAEIDRLMRDRDRVRDGIALEGYACLVPDRTLPGGMAAVDEERLDAVLEYAIAQADLRSGRRRTTVPDYLGTPPDVSGLLPPDSC